MSVRPGTMTVMETRQPGLEGYPGARKAWWYLVWFAFVLIAYGSVMIWGHWTGFVLLTALLLAFPVQALISLIARRRGTQSQPLPIRQILAVVGLTRPAWAPILTATGSVFMYQLLVEPHLVTPLLQQVIHDPRTYDPGHAQRVAQATGADGLAAQLGLFCSVIVIAPIGEEIAFRGVILPGIARLSRRLPRWLTLTVAVLATATMFAVLHPYNHLGQAQIAITGAIFGLCRVLGRSLWPAVAAHATANTVAVASLAGLL